MSWNVPRLVVLRALRGIGGASFMISIARMAIGIWRARLLAGTVGGPPLGGDLTA